MKAWVEKYVSREVWELFEQDSMVLSMLYNQSLPQARTLHAWPLMFRDLRHFRASSVSDFAGLRDEQFSNKTLFEELLTLPAALVEIFRGDMALSAKAFEHYYDRVLAKQVESTYSNISGVLAELVEKMPSLNDFSIQPIWFLGNHGRALGHEILVGLPCPWTEWSTEDTVIQVAHEHAVVLASQRIQCAEQDAHSVTEKAAIEWLYEKMSGIGPKWLSSYERWLSKLDLSGLGIDRKSP